MNQKILNFYVHCFDRFLTLYVNEEDYDSIETLLNEHYDEWHVREDLGSTCLEEYLLDTLKAEGYTLTDITEYDQEEEED